MFLKNYMSFISVNCAIQCIVLQKTSKRIKKKKKKRTKISSTFQKPQVKKKKTVYATITMVKSIIKSIEAISKWSMVSKLYVGIWWNNKSFLTFSTYNIITFTCCKIQASYQNEDKLDLEFICLAVCNQQLLWWTCISMGTQKTSHLSVKKA